jgi:MFS family permease
MNNDLTNHSNATAETGNGDPNQDTTRLEIYESDSQVKVVFFAYILHAIFLGITMSMLDLNTVFPALVSELTESKILFGFLYAIMLGAPLIFNLVFSHYLKSRRYKKKFLLIGIYMRSASFLGMAFSTWFFGTNNPRFAIYTFFVWISLFSISAGFAGIAYSDVLGKVLHSRQRARLFAFKQFFSSIAAFAGGLLIAGLFKPDSLSFPLNYTLSLTVGFIGLIFASFGFYRIREPASPIKSGLNQNFLSYIRNIPHILKSDRQFRRFIMIENLASTGIMILPFYMIYAKDTFQFSQNYLGQYLLIQIAGTILSSFVWGYLASRTESRIVVRYCIYLEAAIPVAAMLLTKTSPILFGAIFFLIGCVISGRRIGFESYLLDIAPDEHRTEYLGIRGTLNILSVIMPVAGGIFISQFGYITIFILVSVFMLVSGQLLKKKAMVAGKENKFNPKK